MEIWHATVYFRGNAYDEDCGDLPAAKEWAHRKLQQLGNAGSFEWKCSDEECTARLATDVSAVLVRRVE